MIYGLEVACAKFVPKMVNLPKTSLFLHMGRIICPQNAIFERSWAFRGHEMTYFGSDKNIRKFPFFCCIGWFGYARILFFSNGILTTISTTISLQ